MATKKKVKKAMKRPAAKKKKAAKRTVTKKKPTAKRKVVAKRSVKKIAAKRAAAKKAPVRRSSGPKSIGEVTHFYREIKVAVVKFSKPVKQGTEVRFKGATTEFSQKLDSMQYDHKAVVSAPKGKQVGVKVKSRVRQGDQVYLA